MSSGGIDSAQSVAPLGATPEIRSKLERYPSNPLLVIRDDISALQVLNADIIGRLIIDGLLNEIVVLRNNIYYLNHNAMGVYSGYSAVFADEKLSLRYPPENILLYGRTSNEGKAFAPLKNYITQGKEFAERYAFLSFNSLYEDARYVIFAVIEADSSPASPDYFDYHNLTFGTDADMLRFVEAAKDRSKYKFNVGVAPSDRLLTFVTLSEGTVSETIVIVCRMLREGESDGLVQTE
jgi:SrtB family sortase